MKDDFIWN